MDRAPSMLRLQTDEENKNIVSAFSHLCFVLMIFRSVHFSVRAVKVFEVSCEEAKHPPHAAMSMLVFRNFPNILWKCREMFMSPSANHRELYKPRKKRELALNNEKWLCKGYARKLETNIQVLVQGSIEEYPKIYAAL